VTFAALRDRIELTAPLAVRFWDEALAAPVRDGLVVTAEPVGGQQVIQASANLSGIYVFHRLPFQVQAGACVVSVTDRLNRFVPTRFTLTAPGGLQTTVCAETDSPPRQRRFGVPLFSSATRGLPPPMAVLRAWLWDRARERPAAWALVEARVGDAPAMVARGLADADGQVMIACPYPESAGLLSQWPVRVEVAYAGDLDVTDVPDLCAVLRQGPSRIWPDTTQDASALESVLSFGQELVLRTRGVASPGVPLSLMWLSAAGSPP
jgi:hypothetical protein